MIFGLFRWVLIGGLGWAAYKTLTGGRPEWMDDVLLRAFSKDHVAKDATQDPNFEAASKVAAEVGLPVAWVLALMKAGVTMADIEPAARDVVQTMQQMGVPVNMLPATLAAYRDKVLGVVIDAYLNAKHSKGV